MCVNSIEKLKSNVLYDGARKMAHKQDKTEGQAGTQPVYQLDSSIDAAWLATPEYARDHSGAVSHLSSTKEDEPPGGRPIGTASSVCSPRTSGTTSPG